jgi:hemerythrin superfamily protein
MTDSQQGQDVVDVLSTDHAEALELIQQAWATTEAERRRDLIDTVITEIVRHAVAEEMYVYPAMREHLPDGDEAVEHDIEEHKELEQTMKQLEGLDADDAEFHDKLRTFEEQLRHHIEDEETEQFPQLRARVPREELVQLAGKVQTAKKLAPTRPHPSAPNNPVFHKLVGPGVGLVDRVRDKLSGRSTS